MMPKTPRDPPPPRDAAHLETAPGHAPDAARNSNSFFWNLKSLLFPFHYNTVPLDAP